MSEGKGISLEEMISEKLSVSPFKSHLSQNVVPSSLFCSHEDCGQIISSLAESGRYSWSCAILAWIVLGITFVFIASGILMTIRCCLKFRYAKKFCKRIVFLIQCYYRGKHKTKLTLFILDSSISSKLFFLEVQ